MTDRKSRARPRWLYRALSIWAALSVCFYFPSTGLAATNTEAARLVALVREGSIAKLAAYLETPGADINARPDVVSISVFSVVYFSIDVIKKRSITI